jgi:microcystin-dependent protein
VGEKGGAQSVTLSVSQLPQHVHFAQASSTAGNAFVPLNNLLAKVEGVDAYQPPTNLVAMSPTTIANTGGSQAHLNMQPFLVLTFCIALTGIFPSRN